MSFDPHGTDHLSTIIERQTPANIVEFGTYHIAMTYPPLADIRRYWDSLRAGRMLPMRSEVDPRDMSSMLETCFILDRQSAGDTRFRVAGMALNDTMGMELRGMHVRSIIEPGARDSFSASLENVFSGPEIQDYDLLSSLPGGPSLTGRMLILPLKGDTGAVDRAMGCLVTEGTIGLPPRRFVVKNVTRTSLATGGIVMESTPRSTPLEAAGFAEPTTVFQQKSPEMKNGTPSSVPYLRVVK